MENNYKIVQFPPVTNKEHTETDVAVLTWGLHYLKEGGTAEQVLGTTILSFVKKVFENADK